MKFKILTISLFFLVSLFVANKAFATFYWYGGSGNWTDYTNHWSLNDGNVPPNPASNAPTSGDDVVFDTLSATTSYTVQLTGSPQAANVTFGNPLSGNLTISNSSDFSIYGNLILASGMGNSYSGGFNFKATSGTKTITSNGVRLTKITFNGSGGTFQLADDLFCNNLVLTAGTFDPNGKTVTLDLLNKAAQTGSIKGNFTFYNLTFTGGNITEAENILLYNNITITNTFTSTGYSAGKNRLLISSDTFKTQRTITAAAISVDKTDFEDIIGAGAASWDMSAAAGYSGNCGDNSMKSLGDAAFTTATSSYFYKASGTLISFTDANWFVGAGGTGGANRVPICQDTAKFDSGFGTTGMTMYQDNYQNIPTIDFTNANNSPVYKLSYNTVYNGSLTLISGMSLNLSTYTMTFYGSGNQTINTGTLTIAPTTINTINGTYTLTGNFFASSLTITSGTFTCVNGGNNYYISVGSLSNSGTLILGSNTHLITGKTGTIWSGGGTISANTSTIKFTGALTGNITFAGGGITTYNNFWNNTTNSYYLTISGSNTFNDFKIDAGRSMKFTNSTTQTVNTFTALGTSGSHITLANTSGTTHATLTKAGGGYITGTDYVDATYLTGSPALTWYIGANSTVTNCTTMYASVPSTRNSNFFFFMGW